MISFLAFLQVSPVNLLLHRMLIMAWSCVELRTLTVPFKYPLNGIIKSCHCTYTIFRTFPPNLSMVVDDMKRNSVVSMNL